MKSVLLALLPLMFAGFQSQAAPALDDLMSPDEIGAEVLQAHPELANPSTQWSLGVQKSARILVEINKSPAVQTMWVKVDGQPYATWRVSTGRERQENPPSGHPYISSTPTGTFTPYVIERDHFSNTWKVHMPFAVFLTGGIAIHAAPQKEEEKMLGHRASGGCIRLSHQNAENFFNLVTQYGRENTRVTIIDQ